MSVALPLVFLRTGEKTPLLLLTGNIQIGGKATGSLSSLLRLLSLISHLTDNYVKAASRQVCVGGCCFPRHPLLLILLSGSQGTGQLEWKPSIDVRARSG